MRCVVSRLGRETGECSVDESRQRVELVAALEDGGDAVAETPATAGELAEAVVGDAHVRERVILMRVEAGRDEHELRREGADGWSSYVTRLAFSITCRAVGSQLSAAATESPKIVTCCSGGRLLATAVAEKKHAATIPLSRTNDRITATM